MNLFLTGFRLAGIRNTHKQRALLLRRRLLDLSIQISRRSRSLAGNKFQLKLFALG